MKEVKKSSERARLGQLTSKFLPQITDHVEASYAATRKREAERRLRNASRFNKSRLSEPSQAKLSASYWDEAVTTPGLNYPPLQTPTGFCSVKLAGINPNSVRLSALNASPSIIAPPQSGAKGTE